MDDRSTHLAYAFGYKDGYCEGVEDNPYGWDSEERQFYKEGYERGVTDYCFDNHREDEE